MHIAIEDLLNEFQNTFTLCILTTALMELTSLTASPFVIRHEKTVFMYTKYTSSHNFTYLTVCKGY